MKYTFLFSLFLYSCGSIAQLEKVGIKEDNPKTEVEKIDEKIDEVPLPFEFSKATSQKFNGGAPGSGSTTMLTVFLNKLTDENLEFSKIWLANDLPFYQLKLKRKFQADNWENYKKDDELILFASSRNNNPKPSAEKTTSSKLPPNKFIGDALIEYTFNGELMYYEIPKLDKLQDINTQ